MDGIRANFLVVRAGIYYSYDGRNDNAIIRTLDLIMRISF